MFSLVNMESTFLKIITIIQKIYVGSDGKHCQESEKEQRSCRHREFRQRAGKHRGPPEILGHG